MTEAAGEGSPPVYRVALIPGDGVGPEVIAGAVSVLEAVGRRFGFGMNSNGGPGAGWNPLTSVSVTAGAR